MKLAALLILAVATVIYVSWIARGPCGPSLTIGHTMKLYGC